MPDAPSIDPARCPLCGAANVCAMEVQRVTGDPQPPCWCMAAPIDAGLLARLPPESRGLACICARCAAGVAASVNP